MMGWNLCVSCDAVFGGWREESSAPPLPPLSNQGALADLLEKE